MDRRRYTNVYNRGIQSDSTHYPIIHTRYGEYIMKVTFTTEGLDVSIECTPAEFNELDLNFNPAEYVDTPETPSIDGYDIKQYDIGALSNSTMIAIHQGFKIHKVSNYYRWVKGPEFDDRSTLMDTIDEAKLEIDDYVVRLNRCT